MLVKYTAPTRFDGYERGFVWVQENEKGARTVWLQTSNEPTAPRWLRLGDCIHEIGEVLIEDKEFMEKIMHLHEKCLEKEST